jgi:hypothetical protein
MLSGRDFKKAGVGFSFTKPKPPQVSFSCSMTEQYQDVLCDCPECGKKNFEVSQIPSARLTLRSTKLCTRFKIFRQYFLGTKVTFEAFLSISQNLKVSRP